MKDFTRHAASRLSLYADLAVFSANVISRNSQARLQSQTYTDSHKGHQR